MAYISGRNSSKYILPMCGWVIALLLTIIFANTQAYAQNDGWNTMLQNIVAQSPEKADDFQTVEDFTGVVLNVALGFGISLSFIAVILSGIKYMTSRSDFKATATAKQALTYSIVALLLTISVFTIKDLVLNLLGAS